MEPASTGFLATAATARFTGGLGPVEKWPFQFLSPPSLVHRQSSPSCAAVGATSLIRRLWLRSLIDELDRSCAGLDEAITVEPIFEIASQRFLLGGRNLEFERLRVPVVGEDRDAYYLDGDQGELQGISRREIADKHRSGWRDDKGNRDQLVLAPISRPFVLGEEAGGVFCTEETHERHAGKEQDRKRAVKLAMRLHRVPAVTRPERSQYREYSSRVQRHVLPKRESTIKDQESADPAQDSDEPVLHVAVVCAVKGAERRFLQLVTNEKSVSKDSRREQQGHHDNAGSNEEVRAQDVPA